ncbi:MAG: hypothetical protein HRF45_05195 [Fimbriimonadia bacterium]|jgi:hypothetical protein
MMAEHPGHRDENDWDEVGQFDLPSGQRVVIETRTETLSATDFSAEEDCRKEEVFRAALVLVANVLATITYSSMCLIGLHRIFAEQNSVGFKVGSGLGVLLFLWAIVICWFGKPPHIAEGDLDAQGVVRLTRIAGVIALIPVLLFAKAIVWGS